LHRLSDSGLSIQPVQVISLSVGQPDFPTPAAVCKAAKAAIDAGQTKYTPNIGTSSLRNAICEKLKSENGLEYSPSEIVVTNGAKQAIWQAILACVSPGDEVIVPAPYWVSYPEMVRLSGGTPVVLDTTAENNFCITAEQLREAVTPKTRLLILCTPSNPSGAVYSGTELSALADVVREHPRMMVSADEIYEHIIYPPHKHVSFASLPDMWERTFTVNGVSKAFAMTGWRIGYIAAPQHFAKAAALIQSQSTSGACSVSQVCYSLFHSKAAMMFTFKVAPIICNYRLVNMNTSACAGLEYSACMLDRGIKFCRGCGGTKQGNVC
jgi:bifunctional aspartate aminotransferase and glutamate/aspartate-prephenate aminotransferase